MCIYHSEGQGEDGNQAAISDEQVRIKHIYVIGKSFWNDKLYAIYKLLLYTIGSWLFGV